MNLDVARLVADAVLYEGYLLYPYRASSSKNHARWQFGVLGPPGAAERGLGEEPDMHMQCLVAAGAEGGASWSSTCGSCSCSAGSCSTSTASRGARARGRRDHLAELGRGGRAGDLLRA